MKKLFVLENLMKEVNITKCCTNGCELFIKKGFSIIFAASAAFVLVVKMKSWWTKRNFSSTQFSVPNAKNGSLCLFILVSDEFTKTFFSFTLSWYLCSSCWFYCSKYVWIYATMLSCYVCGVETVNIITYTHSVVTY